MKIKLEEISTADGKELGNEASVIVSPVQDEPTLTKPAVTGLSDNSRAAIGETMTEAGNKISINFVWIPKEEISSGKVPIPNTSEAPFVENIKRWKTLNPEANVNLYIQQSMIKDNGVEEIFFDNQSLTNLKLLLGSTIDIEIMDRNFYEESINAVRDGVKNRSDCSDFRGCWVKPNNVLKTTLFSCNSSTNEHYADLYARVDFARLLVIERELRIKGSRFAIYVDADISLETGITDICKDTSQDVLLWYIPNIPKNGYFIENQMMGFKPRALPDLDRVITTTAHVINDRKNGYEALRFYSEEMGKDLLKIYASERPPCRIGSIKDAIDCTFLDQGGITPRQFIHVSTTPDLERKLEKQTNCTTNTICSLATKDDSKDPDEKSTDSSQNNVPSNGRVDPKEQNELKSKLNKLKEPDDTEPNNNSCNI